MFSNQENFHCGKAYQLKDNALEKDLNRELSDLKKITYDYVEKRCAICIDLDV